MARSTESTVKGDITEQLPGGLCRVKIGEEEHLCTVSGKMRHNHIPVSIGDKVEVLLDPYGGKTTNRIVRRY